MGSAMVGFGVGEVGEFRVGLAGRWGRTWRAETHGYDG
jgi:hypothetical protein